MTLQQAELRIRADVDGDGSDESGLFVFKGNTTVNPQIRTNFTVGGRGSQANNVIDEGTDFVQNTAEDFGIGDGASNSKPPSRAGFYLDLGGGKHLIEIEFDSWEGSSLQWGNTGDTSQVTQADATGADPLTQMSVLMRYLNLGRSDSRTPASLSYGEYAQGGLYEPIDVVVADLSVQRSAEDGSWFTGSITLLETLRSDAPLDGVSFTG